jgi:Fip1 motif
MEKARYRKYCWRVLIAGADASDYFNYGFDEFTWAAYCSKQTNIRKDFNPGNVMAVRLLFLEHR